MQNLRNNINNCSREGEHEPKKEEKNRSSNRSATSVNATGIRSISTFLIGSDSFPNYQMSAAENY
jgi:hypothetical protein